MAIRFSPPRLTASLAPADVMAILAAASLPWSTTLPAIFIGLWLLSLIPIIDRDEIAQLATRRACLWPILFFGLACIGMLWAEVPWPARLYAVGPVAKLLAIPLLFYHFRRSGRGIWVFVAFFTSCVLLMILSWIVTIDPRLALKADAYPGVPVKNYIDQSQEFALCTIGALYVIVKAARRKRWLIVSLLTLSTISLFANMAFVVVSRTALVTMPIMIAVFAVSHLTRRGMVTALVSIGIIVTAVWFASPNLRERAGTLFSQYHAYETTNESTSIGMRIEFWRKSLRFFAAAPLIGHGSGSVKSLFAEAAAGQTGAAAEIVANPHNQTFYAAVQWGIVGIAILYAMWLSHLLMFRGIELPHWVGLLVVAQNMMSSLFNSHLFDFHAGWMYVLGVGVAGGMVLADQASSPSLHRQEKASI